MKQSPMRLDRYFFTKIHFEALHKGFSAENVFPLQAKVKYADMKNRDEKFVCLGVKKGADSPQDDGAYSFEIEVIGSFSVMPELCKKDPSLANNILRVNAPSILYGAIRQLLIQLTANGPLGSYMLPSMSFIDQKLEPKKELSEMEGGEPQHH